MKVTLSYCYIKEILAEGSSVSEPDMLFLSPIFGDITSVFMGVDCGHKLGCGAA